MANYGYSTPFQGFQQGLPAGYMQAATDPGRNIAAGIGQLSDGIAGAIEKYKAKKAESEYTDQKNADMFQMIQSITQSGNIMDHRTPESQLLKTVMGFTGQKDMEKLGEYAVNSPGLTLAKKKALSHDLEFALSRYDTTRTQSLQEEYKNMLIQQGNQEMAIKQDAINRQKAMPGMISKIIDAPTTESIPGGTVSVDGGESASVKPEVVELPRSQQILNATKLLADAGYNPDPELIDRLISLKNPVTPQLAPGMTVESQTFEIPGYGKITAKNLEAEKAAQQAKYDQELALADIKNKPEIDARTITLPTGASALAPSATAAKELREVITSSQNSLQNIQELESFAKKFAGGAFSLKDKGDASVIANSLKGNLRLVIIGPGAVSDSERKILDSVVANPTSLFSLTSNNKSKLDELKGIINRSMANHLKANGIAPQAEAQKVRRYNPATKKVE